MRRCRLLLIDDSRDLLRAVHRFLAAFPEVEVIGEGTSGAEAIELANRLRPDCVVMDCRMPVMDGLEAARRLKATPGGPNVIILTLYDDPEHRAAAREAGADGFLPKAELGALLPLLRGLGPA